MARYKQGEKVKSVFNYDDYRLFLKDVLSERKNTRKSFTQRVFARKVGFRSHSFCPLVIRGKRSLTAKSTEKIILALSLKPEDAEYFRTLIKYNQSKDIDEKQELFIHLKQMREKTKFGRLDRKAYPFFNKWYYPVVRALAAYSNWAGDYRKLAKMVRPPITVEEARCAVEALESAGLIIRENPAGYRVSSNKITTADVPGIVRNKNRREILLQCLNNTEIMSPGERYLAYTTMATSEKTYKKIAKYLDDVRKNVIDMVMADERSEKVYELVFNVVPFSEKYECSNAGVQGNA